ncbi:MAG: hypothetical protein MUF54_05300 [Polyangiaceae bacterium]|jgi:hypothetical protein|nr:hypothetical protein [Polyangiaceae bacterium]
MTQLNTDKPGELIDKAIRDASEIGRTWATHGLTAGKSALETSASTLRRVASFLGDLSQSIGQPTPADANKPGAETTTDSSSDSTTGETPSAN